MNLLLEVCVDSIQSAQAARAGGADRLEVCSSLAAQGTTPNLGLVEHCVADVGLPVMMMIRPHDGGFVYTDDDLATMLTDIEVAKSVGVRGVVFGALTTEGDIQTDHCARLVEAAASLEKTFHRAFDIAKDPLTALEQIIDLGFHRILTSGQEVTAVEGIPLLRTLNDRANDRIKLLAGAGVNPGNARHIVEQTGIRELHASASELEETYSPRGKLTFGAGRRVTKAEIVRAIKRQLAS